MRWEVPMIEEHLNIVMADNNLIRRLSLAFSLPVCLPACFWSTRVMSLLGQSKRLLILPFPIGNWQYRHGAVTQTGLTSTCIDIVKRI